MKMKPIKSEMRRRRVHGVVSPTGDLATRYDGPVLFWRSSDAAQFSTLLSNGVRPRYKVIPVDIFWDGSAA